MNIDNDYDNDGNNIVPCPICLDVYCPSKEDGKCPQEDEFVKDMNTPEIGCKTHGKNCDCLIGRVSLVPNTPDTGMPHPFANPEGVYPTSNTPDTEFDSDKEVVGSDCLCVLGSKKHNPECEYATPDIEWEKVVEEFYLNFTDIEKQELDTPSWNHNGVTPYLVEQWIRTLLTSRDTYWKERVRKEVEDALRRLDIDDHNYLTARREIAKVSGIPMMAITFNEHLKVIKEKLEATPITNNR